MDHKIIKIVKNIPKMTDKIVMYLCANVHVKQLNFVGVVVSTIYKKTSFLCWCISRKENKSGLNSWYKKFVRQTIGLGAFIGNTSQIVSA